MAEPSELGLIEGLLRTTQCWPLRISTLCYSEYSNDDKVNEATYSPINLLVNILECVWCVCDREGFG